jgi:hypothetical protein
LKQKKKKEREGGRERKEGQEGKGRKEVIISRLAI